MLVDTTKSSPRHLCESRHAGSLVDGSPSLERRLHTSTIDLELIAVRYIAGSPTAAANHPIAGESTG